MSVLFFASWQDTVYQFNVVRTRLCSLLQASSVCLPVNQTSNAWRPAVALLNVPHQWIVSSLESKCCAKLGRNTSVRSNQLNLRRIGKQGYRPLSAMMNLITCRHGIRVSSKTQNMTSVPKYDLFLTCMYDLFHCTNLNK